MQRHHLDHEIHCPPATLWKLYFDDSFNIEMYERGMGFPSCKILERRDDGKTLHRRMAMIPKIVMPAAVAKLVGDKVGFEEIGDWVRSEGVFRWRMLLAAFGDKVRLEGTMKVAEHGAGHCRRIVDFEIEAKMFAVGKLIEGTAADNTIDGWNKSAKWINSCVARC
jgi:hypothetical protein